MPAEIKTNTGIKGYTVHTTLYYKNYNTYNSAHDEY